MHFSGVFSGEVKDRVVIGIAGDLEMGFVWLISHLAM